MKPTKKKIILAAAIICVVAAALAFVFLSQSGDPYIAVYNGEKIMLEDYLIYLVEQQRAFEQTGGKDIWDTNFDGEPAIEMAKRNALESIVYVKTVVELYSGSTESDPLTKEELDQIASSYYESMTDNQKEQISLEAVTRVMGENMVIVTLSQQISDNSVQEIEKTISDRNVEKNPDVWDGVGYLD